MLQCKLHHKIFAQLNALSLESYTCDCVASTTTTRTCRNSKPMFAKTAVEIHMGLYLAHVYFQEWANKYHILSQQTYLHIGFIEKTRILSIFN